MHQYRIDVYYYTAEGSVGNLAATRYADDVETARLICAEYENELQEGTTMKQYQVRLYLQAYKLCEDRSAFFNMFKA